ncbi:CLC11 protein, partial [Polyodon spathula]|nr:CLC11 protein [Polyodon spathula]
VSRLADMDSAIHRLNVFQYNLDVKLSQLSDKVIRMDAKVGKIQDETESISRINKENHREIGRLEGCLKGHRVVRKCFLVYRFYETYAGAVEWCRERGGRIAMPKDKRELAALAKHAREFFHPGNWPLWIGVSDRRSEGLYLFEDGIRVTFFQWNKQLLSSQPDGGKRENCVTLTSDDGDWWDTDCERRTYFACEFDG